MENFGDGISSLSNQIGIAALQNPQPITQIVCRATVNNSAWSLLYTVPQGTFLQLKELLVYNGDATTKNWRIAILNPTDTDPTGTSVDTPFVYMSGELDSGESVVKELWTGLNSQWELWGYSDADPDINFNMCVSGLVVTTQ